MGKHYFKISWVFLRIWLLFQLCPQNGFGEEVHKDNDAVIESKTSDGTDLNSRLTKLEAKSQHQEVKIEVLQTQLEEERKFSKQLSSRISQLEAFSENDQVLQRPKRPYRLLPPSVHYTEKDKNYGEKNQKVSGPATNCNELALLGYSLNGYHLIKKKDKSKYKTKIAVVYCQFQQLPSQKQALETSIGNLNVKTKSVHFYVQRNSNFSTTGKVPWELARLNEGEAMNLTSGVFTAPVPGLYHFDFSFVKDKSDNELKIGLDVNARSVAVSKTSIKNEHATASLSTSLRLKASDKVAVWRYTGTIYDESYHHHSHFRGWLVEDLSV